MEKTVILKRWTKFPKKHAEMQTSSEKNTGRSYERQKKERELPTVEVEEEGF